MWPTALQQLTFGKNFNKPIDKVVWPDRLKHLSLGACFDKPRDRASWPASLERLLLGGKPQHFSSKTPMPSVGRLPMRHALPSSPCPYRWVAQGSGRPPDILRFNLPSTEPMPRIGWAVGVKRVTFSADFDQCIEYVTWPATLQCLTFGACFNQPIHGVTLPSRLQQLTFGTCSNQPLSRVV